MKEYNRTTKRWEESDKNGSLKKRELCKGKRPHDFVLLVPRYIHVDHNLFKDEIEEYYVIESERDEMEKKFDERLSKIGIRVYGRIRHLSKRYYCSVCGKEKYDY